MKLQKQIGRSVSRRNRKVLSRRPSVESFEPRVLMSNAPVGFVQGYVTGANNAQVELENPSNNAVIQSTVTDSTGYFQFNNVPAGDGVTTFSATYNVVVAQTGYATTGVNYSTTVDQAAPLANNAGIQVTVEDLAKQSYNVNWNLEPYTYQSPNLTFTSSFQSPTTQTFNQPAGQLGVTLSGNAGNTNTILSLCSDLIGDISFPDQFVAQPSLSPPHVTPSPTALGEMAYLYNTYGQTLDSATPGAADNGAALQMALWRSNTTQPPSWMGTTSRSTRPRQVPRSSIRPTRSCRRQPAIRRMLIFSWSRRTARRAARRSFARIC